jgi:large conductance mechanosensitive channel
MRGNVMDMAVGIIIGVAFGKIVSSFVADIMMPPLGMLLGNINFTELAIVLKPAVGEVAAVTLSYGMFIQTIVDFLIVAFAVFLVVKWMNSLKKKEEVVPAPPAEATRQETILGEIRDLLKEKPSI